jgi:phosphoribosylformylglycinamidine synthase subunit PurQ / glutaminase
MKILIPEGCGIGCDNDAAEAWRVVGASPEKRHFNMLATLGKGIFDYGAINLSGGFMQADYLRAGMCAANELEHLVTSDEGKRLKDLLLEFAQRGRVIYGQCNGFQLLVRLGLLPGIGDDYSEQTVTLTNNDCGNYRVAWVEHKVERPHFAFEGFDTLGIWCRHGEGKIQFSSDYGLVPNSIGAERRADVNERHVLLRYVDPVSHLRTQEFPQNPNGSVDAIAGLVDTTGNIFAHMAHTEVTVHREMEPDFFIWKDQMRRHGYSARMIDGELMHGRTRKVFENIMAYLK